VFSKTPLNKAFKITYSQNGGIRTKGFDLCIYSKSKEYKILKFKDDETTKKKLMFQIFRDLSYSFEKQQREIFWGTMKVSAFRDGDLMGNLIGFYIASGEISKEEASKLCGQVPISISLQLEKEGKLQTNDSFSPAYRLNIKNNEAIFPQKLTKYNDLFEVKNYISQMKETNTLTVFNKSFEIN